MEIQQRNLKIKDSFIICICKFCQVGDRDKFAELRHCEHLACGDGCKKRQVLWGSNIAKSRILSTQKKAKTFLRTCNEKVSKNTANTNNQVGKISVAKTTTFISTFSTFDYTYLLVRCFFNTETTTTKM